MGPKILGMDIARLGSKNHPIYYAILYKEVHLSASLSLSSKDVGSTSRVTSLLYTYKDKIVANLMNRPFIIP